MNANRWPLERVRRIEFETPLPLNECMRRVEQLHEPHRLRHELPLRAINHQWRIAVHRDVKFSGQVLYNIGLIFITEPYTAKTVSKEVRLKLLPLEYNTRVIIQYPEMSQAPNHPSRITGKVLMVLTIICVAALMIDILAGTVQFSFFCFVMLIVSMLISINNRYRYQTKQQKMLLRRIYKAFDLTYRTRWAMEQYKEKS